MNEIKMIACDLDGTLLHGDKSISPKTIETLQKVTDKGIYFVPSTGRYYKGIPECVRDLPFVRYAITINGAAVIDTHTDETLYEATISSDSAVPILEYFKDLKVAYNFYTRDSGYMDRCFINNIEDYLTSEIFIKTVRKLYTPVDDLISFMKDNFENIHKFQIFTNEPEKLRMAADFVNSLGLPLTVTSSYVYNLEVNSIEATKGKALGMLSKHLGIKVENTASFGDGGNDVNMLQAAGCAIAMSNARTAVKEAADFITLSNDEDGVAEWIDKYILK